VSSVVRFGTAGLRAPMGDGPGQFNAELVARATHGLARYLKERQVPGPVIVGFDARHGSAGFAAEAASVFAAAGFGVMLMPRPLPTPVLAYAVRGAAAGVMVTASHNPATDNGYKVYLADGAQVAPPEDAAIETAIAAAPPGSEIRSATHGLSRSGDTVEATLLASRQARSGRIAVVPETVVESYLKRAVGVLQPDGPRVLRVAYTPLHGVAGETFRRAWAAGGFAPLVEVREQAMPNPDFPTVAFPNPEEPGAQDLAVAAAVRSNADLVLAHDPDGDRCAVMIPAAGGFRALSGDEVGALLAEHLLSTGRIPADGTLATTIVSSPLLERIAEAHDRRCVRTLTGFKWLARVTDLAYAYEEALGYCTDPAGVRDKDGITAALLVAELAACCRAEGTDLQGQLDDLDRRYGAHASAARSLPTTDSGAVADVLARLLADPPSALAGHRVSAVTDLSGPGTGLPPTPGVRLDAGSMSAIVRPSGTEPKLKIYLHAARAAPAGDLARDRAALAAALTAAGTELVARLET
jgi:phosphomannomutase